MSDISPNENLVPLEFHPIYFDLQHTGDRQCFSMYVKGEGVVDEWIEWRKPDGKKWYTYVSSSGIGKSKSFITQDEKIGRIIDVTDEVKISTSLKRFLIGIQKGIHFNDAFSELLISFNPLIPKQNYNYEYPKARTKEVVSKVMRVIEAFNEDYNEKRIEDFRSKLRKQINKETGLKETIFCTPGQMIEFKNRLKQERKGYGIDALLYGSVKGITDLCMLYTTNRYESNSNQFDNDKLLTFNKLIYPLLSGTITHPSTIFGKIITTVVQEGNFGVLKKFISAYEEYMMKNIEFGLNSDNLDFHLNYLFDAIDYCYPVFFMSQQILLNANTDIPEGESIYFQSIHDRYDEILARLMLPFSYQICF